MTETTRPKAITQLLQTLHSQGDLELARVLEEYLSQLESPTAVAAAASPANSVPPKWSHQRSMERQLRQQRHALQKQKK